MVTLSLVTSTSFLWTTSMLWTPKSTLITFWCSSLCFIWWILRKLKDPCLLGQWLCLMKWVSKKEF